MSSPTIRLLGPGDASVLDKVAPNVFDGPILKDTTKEFLNDPRHHLAVAIVNEQVVGMASAVHYIHPDKPPTLWINEVGVDDAFLRQGIGRRLLAALFDRGQALGCKEAWVGTETTNTAARRLYEATGGSAPEDFVMYTFNLDSTADPNTGDESKP